MTIVTTLPALFQLFSYLQNPSCVFSAAVRRQGFLVFVLTEGASTTQPCEKNLYRDTRSLVVYAE